MQNKNNDKDNEKLTPHSVFVLAVKLVAFAVLLYVTLNHFDAVLAVVKSFFALISPLLIGALIALVLNTPMLALERGFEWTAKKTGRRYNRRAGEIIALLVTFLAAFLIIYTVLYSIIPQIGDSLKAVYKKAVDNIPKLMEWMNSLDKYGIDTSEFTAWLADLDVNSLIKKFTDNASNILEAVVTGSFSAVSSIFSGASSIISGVVTAVSAIVFAVYILSNKSRLGNQMKQLGYAYIKKETVDKILAFCSLSAKTFSNFISGQCLESVILGLMFFIAMTVFRFDYALAVSTLITVTAIIPYIGAFLGCAFGMLLMVIDDPLKALLFLVMFLIIQQIENHLVYPRVVGGSVGLPAIWTFAAVIIGGGLCGVIGMVLFIPLFSVIYTILSENVKRRLNERGIVVESGEDEESTPDKSQKPPKENKRKLKMTTAELTGLLFSKAKKKRNAEDAENNEDTDAPDEENFAQESPNGGKSTEVSSDDSSAGNKNA